MVLLSSVNAMKDDFDTQTTSPCPCAVSVQCGVVDVATSVLAVSMDVFMLDVVDMNNSASQPASKMSHKNWIIRIYI